MVFLVDKVTAVIWFNGPSHREWLHLPRALVEIGCNYFADVRPVDHICCYDDRMKASLTLRPDIQYWCRNGQRGQGWNEVTYVNTDNPENSGMMAIKLAINLGHQRIRVIGCDWGLERASVFESRYLNASPGKKYNNHSRKLLKSWSLRRDIKFIHHGPIDVPVPVISAPDW